MTQYGFYTNTDICTGCKACMTACFDRNGLEVPQKFRKVWEFGGGDWAAGADGSFTATAFTYYTSLTCNHCDSPACIPACPPAAISKSEDTGIVKIDPALCIGCMECEKACPYHHPTLFSSDGLAHKCVLCSDENTEGLPFPACARACPVRALEFDEIEVLREKYGNNCESGELKNTTNPNVVIGLHRDAAKGGTLQNPLEVSHEQ